MQNTFFWKLLQATASVNFNYLFHLATRKPYATVFDCGFGQAYCKDHTECYEKTGRCDGVYDCRDHSDEDHCEGHKHSKTKRMYHFLTFTSLFCTPSVNLDFEKNWNSTFFFLENFTLALVGLRKLGTSVTNVQRNLRYTKNGSFPLTISSVNKAKSAGNCILVTFTKIFLM